MMTEQESVWVRLPRSGGRLEGLSRAHIYKLIEDGRIESRNLKEPGASRGVRLVKLDSLRSYIDHAESGEKIAGGGS